MTSETSCLQLTDDQIAQLAHAFLFLGCHLLVRRYEFFSNESFHSGDR